MVTSLAETGCEMTMTNLSLSHVDVEVDGDYISVDMERGLAGSIRCIEELC